MKNNSGTAKVQPLRHTLFDIELISFFDILLTAYVVAAAAKDKLQIEALTKRVSEIQGMSGDKPFVLCVCTFTMTVTYLGIPFLGEKEQLAKVLRQAEESSKSHAAELKTEREEVTRLKAELEKMKEDHKKQITQVTDSATSEISNAKAELAEREKALHTEIETDRRAHV